MCQAVAEIRYSSVKQNNGYSVELQKNAILETAKAFGFDNVKFFYDLATSAKKHGASEWSGMQQLVEYVKTHEVNYFFYYMEDRLTRQGDDFFLDVFPQIKRYAPHCKMVNASERRLLDPYSPEGVLKIAQGVDDNDKRSKRAVAAQLAQLEKGYLPGQRPNYGYSYDKENNSLMVYEPHADIVRFVFHLASWGHSCEVIASILNQSGVPSPANKDWSKGSIHAILRHEIYTGTRSWNFNPLHQVHEETVQTYLSAIEIKSIISPAQWYRANGLTSKNKKAIKLDTPYFFRDLLTCRHCGNAAIATKDFTPGHAKQKICVYYCATCHRKASIDMVHNQLLPYIQEHWYPKLFTSASATTAWLHKFKLKLEKIIKTLNREWLELDLPEGKNQGILTPEERAQKLIEGQLNAARQSLTRVEAFLRDPVAYYNTVEKWGSLDFFGLTNVELRRFLIETVESISFDLDGKNKPIVQFWQVPNIEFEVRW